MTIGHLGIAVIGYLLFRRAGKPGLGMAFAMGSVLPDLDLLWWYFIGKGMTPHHLYWTHLPSFWLFFGAVAAILGCLGAKDFLVPLGAFLLAILIHLIVDTHAGGIAWLHPFSHRMFYLFPVPNSYGNFVLSAVLHWTFLLELPFVIWAAVLLWQDRRAFIRR